MRKKLLAMVVSCLMATSIIACGESNVSTDNIIDGYFENLMQHKM